MSLGLPDPFGVSFFPAHSAKITASTYGFMFGVQREPTDPYFYDKLTLQNVVDGSRYRVFQESDPSNVIAEGVQSGSGDIVINSIPAYENPMLMTIRIRNASGSTKYKALETGAYLVKGGATSYISQQVDE